MRLRYNDEACAVKQMVGVTARRTFAYDDFAHQRTIVDAYDHTTVHRYDTANRLIAVTDPAGMTIRYQ